MSKTSISCPITETTVVGAQLQGTGPSQHCSHSSHSSGPQSNVTTQCSWVNRKQRFLGDPCFDSREVEAWWYPVPMMTLNQPHNSWARESYFPRLSPLKQGIVLSCSSPGSSGMGGGGGPHWSCFENALGFSWEDLTRKLTENPRLKWAQTDLTGWSWELEMPTTLSVSQRQVGLSELCFPLASFPFSLASLIRTQPHTWSWTFHDCQVSTFKILTPAALLPLVWWFTLGLSGASSSGWGWLWGACGKQLSLRRSSKKGKLAWLIATFNATFTMLGGFSETTDSWFLPSLLPLLLLFRKYQTIKESGIGPKQDLGFPK